MTDKLRTRDEFMEAVGEIPVRDRPAWLQAHDVEFKAIVAKEQRENEAINLEERAKERAEARTELRTKKGKRARKIINQLTRETREKIEAADKVRHEEELPLAPHGIPRAWIMDGSWALLNAQTCKVLVVLRRLLDPAEEWTHVDRDVLAALTGCSGRTLRRAITEATESGWLRMKKEKLYRGAWPLALYGWPPLGIRIPIEAGKVNDDGEEEDAEAGGDPAP